MLKFIAFRIHGDACRSVLFFVSFLLSISLLAQNDLPNPPSHTQTISAGSFVIPMDNDLQSIVPAGQAPFNLKAYGLINQFLLNGIPVKWAISAAKQKDGIDLTASVERHSPSFLAASTLNFRSGPFLVPDTVLPCGFSTREIIATFGSNVAVYKLTTDVSADIRYTLTHRPKIAVFNNGGNQLIHTKILDAAGIGNYDVMDAADIANLINCYTFVSEPHADTDQISMTVINAIRAYVLNGGNFLAQCHAVDAYENKAFFVSTAGIDIVNATVSNQYPNPDLALSQMHGNMQANEGGSVRNWTLKSGSNWHSYTYSSVSDLSSEAVVALGAHLTNASSPGGNVFYLGGHDYSKGQGNSVDLSSIGKLNALRLYLNGIFVPSKNSNGAWANAGNASTISCNDSAVLGCTPTGPLGSTFSWTPAFGLSCADCPNPIARPSKTTTYTVEVINGCVARDTVTVRVESKPLANFNNTTVCLGKPTQFTDLSPNATLWQWNFGEISTGTANHSTLQNPSHIYRTPGTFKVTLISGIKQACVDTAERSVTVENSFLLSTISTPVKCYDSRDGAASVTVTGGSSPYVYRWDTSPAQTSAMARNLGKGIYKVTVSDARGCEKADSTTILGPPILSVNLGPDLKLCSENDPAVTISANIGVSFSWQPTGEVTQQISTKLAGTYTVTITDATGCKAKDSVKVQNVCPPRLFVSNSFTPNNDGINDQYHIYGEHFTEFHMFIFNRWGEVIFESKDKTVVWDGKYREEPMPIGVYPWIITYAGEAEEYYGPYRLKGSVTVVR